MTIKDIWKNKKYIIINKLKTIRLNTVSMVFGIIIVLYFIGVSINWGRIDPFNVVMMLLGIVWIIITVKIKKIYDTFIKLPKIIKIILKVITFSLILSFIVVEGIIFSNMRTTATDEADYVIVLGCQVDGSIPSIPLWRRVIVAVNYLRENQNTNVVISGGQGPGENISEAEAMRRILIRNGIDENRIFAENNSKSTMENFKFSDDLYDLHDKNIVIVSTDYHMFRAVSIAKKLNYQNVMTLPSKSVLSVLPVYLLREYASIMYYKLSGKI
jgi:uncharacterized SAM-binding protein YcdF (DUF218 family)